MEGAAPQVLDVPGYRLHRVVGVGGFGRVHLATPVGGAQEVAIKVLHRSVDDATAERVRTEIQVMGTLGWHPGIVRIIDAGVTDGGQPFIVMEHMARGSLGGVLRREGPLPWKAVRAHAIQAATALQVAHQAGLLHRDIKPDNLLLADDGQVKLSDFGVTMAAEGAGTSRGTTGTLAYSAPELLEGRGATPATDVYALGATMFALVTGQPAFQRDTDEAPVAMVLRAYREAVPDLRPLGVPDPIARVVERAMAKDPTRRPTSAQDLATELQTAGAEVGLQQVAVIGAGRGGAPAPPAAAAAAGPGQQYSPEQRARARRLQRLTARAGGIAAVLVVVAFVSVGSLRGFGPLDQEGDTAAPAADAPAGVGPADEGLADPDPAGQDPADEGPADEGAADQDPPDPAPGVDPDDQDVGETPDAAEAEPPIAPAPTTSPLPAQPPPAPTSPATPPAAPPPDDAPLPLAPNTTQAGEITAAAPTVTYVFEGATDQAIELRLTAAAAGLEPTLTLIGPDGATVATAAPDDPDDPGTTAGTTTLSLQLPADGTYQVVVSAEGTGPFDLLLRAR